MPESQKVEATEDQVQEPTEIVELDDGALGLRFTFSLDVDGLEEGSPEESAFAERMSQSYFQGVGTTLAEIRRQVAAGELDAA